MNDVSRDIAPAPEGRKALAEAQEGEELSYLALQPSQRWADAQAVAAMGASGVAGLAVLTATLAGGLAPGLGLLAVLLLSVTAAAGFVLLNQRQRVSRLEIMPGVATATSGVLRHKETIVHYDAIAAATVSQGALERLLWHTATLELSLVCQGGLVKLGLPGLDNAAAHRESLLQIGRTHSLERPQSEQLELARQTVNLLSELAEDMQRTRQRLERL